MFRERFDLTFIKTKSRGNLLQREIYFQRVITEQKGNKDKAFGQTYSRLNPNGGTAENQVDK
jgi:hypothetical protein